MRSSRNKSMINTTFDQLPYGGIFVFKEEDTLRFFYKVNDEEYAKKLYGVTPDEHVLPKQRWVLVLPPQLVRVIYINDPSMVS